MPPILYDQPFTGLVFPNTELAAAIPTADAQVHRLIKAHLEELAAASTEELDIVERLRRELRHTIGSRHCTLEGICQRWGAHPRGLQRRLSARGTGFRDLLQDVRHELAEAYLRNLRSLCSSLEICSDTAMPVLFPAPSKSVPALPQITGGPDILLHALSSDVSGDSPVLENSILVAKLILFSDVPLGTK